MEHTQSSQVHSEQHTRITYEYRLSILASVLTGFVWRNLPQNYDIRMQGGNIDDSRATRPAFLL